MRQIQEVTKQMTNSIEQISGVGQEQAASIQQISMFIKEIQEMSNKLNTFANNL